MQSEKMRSHPKASENLMEDIHDLTGTIMDLGYKSQPPGTHHRNKSNTTQVKHLRLIYPKSIVITTGYSTSH